MTILLALAAFVFTGTPIRAAQQPLLRQVRQALTVAGPAWKATEVQGKAIHEGADHTYSYAFLPDGRFVQSLRGPNTMTYGNDGRNYWQEDGAHSVATLDLEDLDVEMTMNLLLSDTWLLAPAPVRLTENGDSVDLQFRASGQHVTILIDRTSGLPAVASYTTSAGVTTIKLSAWRVAGDRKLPMHAEVTTADATDTYDGAELREVPKAEVRTEVPAGGVTDTTFDPDKSPIVETRFAGRNHILVHALVNGQDVGWFILDSGSGAMIIDKAVANALHLNTVGHGVGTGVGGNVESSARVVSEFKIGPATVKNLVFGDYDLTQIGKGGAVPLAGIIGTAFFRRAVVTVDWSGPVVKVFDRDKYTLEGGSWERLRFSGGNPAVQAQVYGAPKSWFRLDTGGAGFLSLHSPFVTRWNLLEGKETTGSGSTGVGGTMASRMGKIKWFELAGRRFDNPTVEFSTAKSGTFSDTYLAGNVGLDVIRQFRLVLDFTGNRVAFLR